MKIIQDNSLDTTRLKKKISIYSSISLILSIATSLYSIKFLHTLSKYSFYIYEMEFDELIKIFIVLTVSLIIHIIIASIGIRLYYQLTYYKEQGVALILTSTLQIVSGVLIPISFVTLVLSIILLKVKEGYMYE